MGKVLGSLMGIEDGSKAAKQGDYQFGRANRMSDGQLAQAKAYFENTERLFGPLIENIAGHLNSMNASTLAARDIAAFEAQTAAVLEQTESEFNTRFGEGVTASALQEHGLLTANLDAAKIRAQIKATAGDRITAQKQQFIQGIGLPQIQQASAQLNQAYGQGAALSANIGSQYLGRANQKDTNFSSFINTIVGGAAKVGAAAAGGAA